MGKYSEALSVWEHKIGKIEHRLIPEEEDNLEFLRLKKVAQKNDDERVLFKGVGDIYFKMVMRTYPQLSEEDQKELRRLIGQQLPKLVNEMIVAFGWATKEDLTNLKDKAIDQQLKKGSPVVMQNVKPLNSLTR